MGKNEKLKNGSINSADGITDHDCGKANASKLPLVADLQALAKENPPSFHFPGHSRGHAAPPSLMQLIGEKPFLHDPHTFPELDNFFDPAGAILEAKKMAAELFGAAETWFLVGGTTCGIQAAIMASCSPGDILILPRNSHISAFFGMVFSGAVPKYIIPQYNSNWDICGGITPSQASSNIKYRKFCHFSPSSFLFFFNETKNSKLTNFSIKQFQIEYHQFMFHSIMH